MANYKIIFEGKVRAGQDPYVVREKIRQLFSCDDARLNALFSGKPIVIKNHVDEAKAQKYQIAINHAGAECQLEPLQAEDALPLPKVSEMISAAPPPAENAEATQETHHLSAYDAVHAKPADYDPGEAPQTVVHLSNLEARITAADELSASPIEDRIMDETPPPKPPQVDLSGLSLADIGDSLSDKKVEPEVDMPDISGLSLEEPK